MVSMPAIMDTILMEMSKMWKVTDGYTDEEQTIVNRPRHELAWSKAPGELTTEDLQDGCYIVDIITKWFKQFWISMLPQCLPSSFGLIWLTIREQMRFEDFQDGHLGAILCIGTEQF